MDPVSIAAGTAGIVTLGLQICGSLVTYCKAWRSHDRDVEIVLERLTILSLTLESLDRTLSAYEIDENDTADNFRVARDKIHSCTANLNKLHSLLVELESIGQPAGVLDKIHNARLRSIALFNKEKFRRLQDSIQDTQLKLDSAMQILQLQLNVRQVFTLEKLAAVHRETVDQIPTTIEHVVNKQLDLYGRHWSALQQDTASQHIQALQNLTNSISALQLGMIKKPSLLQSAADEQRQIQLQNTSLQRRFRQHCTCRALFKYNKYGQSRSSKNERRPMLARWRATTFSTSLTHHRDCMLFRSSQETKEFGFRISFTGPLLQGAVQAAMSMTRGSGGFSLSPALAFNYVVRSDTGPFEFLNFSGLSFIELRDRLDFSKEKLVYLYQQGNASPSDVDENGDTVLHKVCAQFSWPLDTTEFNELYIQFLRDLYELGVPLNNTNAVGLTPLGVYVAKYLSRWPAHQELHCIMRMLDLGAELPLFGPKSLGHGYDIGLMSNIALTLNIAGCPDLAEAFGCNEISLAIVAKSRPWLMKAIRRHPESISQPNALGQTALHLSVYWPEGLRYLLEAGANFNAVDFFGLTAIYYTIILGLREPLNVLAGKECFLHTADRSLLESVIAYHPYEFIDFSKAFKEELQVTLDSIIRIVVERRQKLEVLARTLLDAEAVESLRLSSEAVLDHKASRAISLLRQKTNIPAWLTNLTREQGTVYHISGMTRRHAQTLWDAGFREIDELDEWGLSPLMTLAASQFDDCYYDYAEHWGAMVWLIAKGADLHCRQEFVFREDADGTMSRLSKKMSSTTALHYLAAELGLQRTRSTFSERKEDNGWPFLDGEAVSEEFRRLQIHILTDDLPDSCDCGCSAMGCRGYTMFAKTVVGYIQPSLSRATIEIRERSRERLLQVPPALPRLLDGDSPSLAWLPLEMIRFNTFEKLDLRHTCCQFNDWNDFNDVEEASLICEPYDDEEIHEIQEEQAEELEKLENLLVEFENKYLESGSSLKEFLGGYWKDRMNEVLSEESPVDHEALKKMGIVLRK